MRATMTPPTDPTESGGLFSRRASGRRPLRYRGQPVTHGGARRSVDRTLAGALLLLEALVGLSIFGPQPYAWFWIGSQVQYLTGSASAGIATILFGSLATLMLTVVVMKRIDEAWVLVRRASGYRQREGVIERIFAVCVAVSGVLFLFWFLIIEGPAPTIAPTN